MTRRILITGASRGIGRSCALWLARTEAAHLILLGRDAQALAASAEAVRQAGGTAEIHVADVAHRSVLTALTGSVGPLDGLVAAAGISGMTPVDRDSDAFFDEILATDLTGPCTSLPSPSWWPSA